MIGIRHVIRGLTALLVLALSVGGASAAFGIRVAPRGAGGAPHTDPVGLQASPLWVFLVVAAGAVVATLVADRLVTRLRDAPRGRRSPA